MIFFGHLGLTTGVFKTYETAKAKIGQSKAPAIDYRLVLVGAELPDLIDKPIGIVLFRDTFHSGRVYAHTLLFALLILIWGAVRYGRAKKNGVLIVGIGTLLHLIFDSMWTMPENLLWPFTNIGAALSAGKSWLVALLRFPVQLGDWLESDLYYMARNLSWLLFEIAGSLVLLYFLVRLIRDKGLGGFFRKGKL